MRKYAEQSNLKKQFFKQATFKFSKNKIKYFSIKDNYELDEYCQLFFEKFQANPYFVNKWYSMDSFHRFLIKDLKNENLKNKYILEFGAGLGITSALLKLYGYNILPADYQFSACMLINDSLKINLLDANAVNADWTNPPFKQFDAIIGADIIYEKESAEHIFNCISKTVKPNGLIYIANFDNYAYQLLIDKLNSKFSKLHSSQTKNLGHKIIINKFQA